MSELKDDRQQVLVGKKFLGLKPSNLSYQLRPVDSLSLQELKKILKRKDENANFAGLDVADLRRDVNSMSPEEAFEYLALANAEEYVEKERAKEQQSSANTQDDEVSSRPDLANVS